MAPASSLPPIDADLPDAERRLEALWPGYLDKVRLAAEEMGRLEPGKVDVAIALAEAAEAAAIDTDVPTLASRRSVHLLKRAVKALVGWYLRFLAQQVSTLGESLVRLGAQMTARTDQLEDATITITRDLDQLRGRVEQLEAQFPPSAD